MESRKRKEIKITADEIIKAQILEMQPGDILVLKSPCLLSDLAYTRLNQTMASVMPKDTKIIVLDDGMDIAILRNADRNNETQRHLGSAKTAPIIYQTQRG